MKLALSFLLLSIGAYAQINFNPRACEPRFKNVEKAFKEARPTMEVLNSAMGSDTRLLVLGEDHDEYDSKEALLDFYTSVKKDHPELNCVFLELPNEHQELAEMHLRGEISFEEMIRKKVHRDFNGKPYTEEYVQQLLRRLAPWFSLARKAYQEGSKVKLLDLTMEEQRQIYYRRENDTPIRNFAFAEKMDQLFKSGECGLAFMPIGYMHTNLPMVGQGKDTRVQELVRQKGHKAFGINFTNTTYEVNSPFFFLNYDFESYFGYYHDYEFNPYNDEDVARARKFNNSEIACTERVKAILPKESVILPGKDEILPAYGKDGIISPRTYGDAANRKQVDFWLWLHRPQRFKVYPEI